MQELTAQVGISEFYKRETWYENAHVCGIESVLKLARVRTRFYSWKTLKSQYSLCRVVRLVCTGASAGNGRVGRHSALVWMFCDPQSGAALVQMCRTREVMRCEA